MKRTLISALIVILALFVSYNSWSQPVKKVGAMFGTQTVGDSLMVIRGPVTSCGGTGICSASSSPVEGAATITMSAGLSSALAARKTGSYTITMKIWKRKLNKTKKHKTDRKLFRQHNYMFEQNTRIPVAYISGAIPKGAKYAIIPGCTLFKVKNHFLGHFEMTITGVRFE